MYEAANNDLFAHCTSCSCCISSVPARGPRLTLCGNQEECSPGECTLCVGMYACIYVYTCVHVCMLVYIAPLTGPWMSVTG